MATRKPQLVGQDGLPSSKSREESLNKLFASLFESPSGQEVLDYLRSITVNMVYGPDNVSHETLTHMEGQRYIVSLITRRVGAAHRKEQDG